MSQIIQRKQAKRFLSKDRFIFSVLLLVLSFWPQPKVAHAQAQWTDQGGLSLTTTVNVGIGTTTPDGRLTLDAPNDTMLTIKRGGTNMVVLGDTGIDNAGSLRLYDSNGNVTSVLSAVGSSYFSGGNLAIGAPTADAMLRINNSVDQVGLYLTNGNTTSTANGLEVYSTGLANQLTFIAGGSIQGASAYIPGLAVQTGGNVGIGTTVPGHKLEVNQSTDYKWAGYFKSTAPTTGGKHGVIIDAGSDASDSALYLRDASGSTSFMIVRGNGNIGMGTTNPDAKLALHAYNSNAETVALSLYPATSGGIPAFGIGMGPTASEGYLAYRSGTGNSALFGHKFFVNNLEMMRIRGDGNVGIGTSTPSTKLHVVGDVTVTGNIAAKYQDVAEWVTSPKSMSSGTVVILDIDHSNQVLPSVRSYDTRVAGVISEMPGIILGEGGDGKVKVATTGRVKVKVDATKKPVQVGDLLVTSDKEGVAMKSEPLDLGGVPIHRPGTLIGKALEPLKEGEGEILVLLSLQ